MTNPALSNAQHDPAAPDWMKRLLLDIQDRDPVDVLNALTWIVEQYEAALDQEILTKN